MLGTIPYGLQSNKEILCPSGGNINRLMMMMMIVFFDLIIVKRILKMLPVSS
jgi:hypothetical protein